MNISVTSVLVSLYTLLFGYISYKIIKWLIGYFYKFFVINKIKGLEMLPFIGNVHQFRRKHGMIDLNLIKV